MSLSPRRTLLPLLLLFGVALPARAEHGVHDEARIFSHEKVSEADDAIDDLRHLTHKDLLIETMSSAEFLSELSPEEQKAFREPKNEAERVRLFEEQAKKRAKHWQVNGVYILLCAGSKDEELLAPRVLALL